MILFYFIVLWFINMDYTELLAKQGVLEKIYNRERREYKLKKSREEKARVRALIQLKKINDNPQIQENKIG
jgi:hypothetical protein